MKATTLLLIAIAGIAQATHGQPTGYRTGAVTMSIGYGMVDAELHRGRIIEQHFGPMYCKFEYALTDFIGMGLNVAYAEARTSRLAYPYTANINLIEDYARFSALWRTNVHLTAGNRADLYIGWGLGCKSLFESTTGLPLYPAEPNGEPAAYAYQYNYGQIAFGADCTLGLNYYLGEQIALYAEAGIAKSLLQGGFTMRF